MDEAATNRQLRELWYFYMETRAWPAHFSRLWPMQYPAMPRGGVAFVGLNPSSADETEVRVGEIDELLSEERARVVVARERAFIYGAEGRQPLDYYRSFAELAGAARPWSYLDLLPVREQDPYRVHRVLQLNRRQPHPFATEWLRLSIALLHDLRPAVVVVPNAFAACLLFDWLEHNEAPAVFDEHEGTYRISLGGAIVPCLPAGMLTGRHAMDQFSRQRLEWHITRCLRDLPTRG